MLTSSESAFDQLHRLDRRGCEAEDDHHQRQIIGNIRSLPRSTERPFSGPALTQRADAEAVGLLDERYFMYTEDVDFCASIRKRGRRVLFTPEVEVVHLRGRSAASAPAATREAYRRSHLAFYQKHHPSLVPFLRAYLWIRRGDG